MRACDKVSGVVQRVSRAGDGKRARHKVVLRVDDEDGVTRVFDGGAVCRGGHFVKRVLHGMGSERDC